MRSRDLKVGKDYAYQADKYSAVQRAVVLGTMQVAEPDKKLVTLILIDIYGNGWEHDKSYEDSVLPAKLLRPWDEQVDLHEEYLARRAAKRIEGNQVEAWFNELGLTPYVGLDSEDPPGFKITFRGSDADFIIEAVKDWLT